MPVIRVLHMIGCLEVGGSQSMVMNIYRNIDRNKIQFDFIVDKVLESPFTQEIHSLGGRIYKLPKFNGTNILELRKSWNNFFNKHAEYRILHSHVRSYASLYIPIAKKHGLTTIIHSHSTSNGSGITSVAKKILQYPLRFQADYFFACSQESGEWLFGNRITKQDKFKIIPNAIDVRKYAYNEENRSKIRKEFQIENRFVVGHIGRFIEAKNHDFLIDIFYELHKEKAESVLLLVGDGELKDQIKEKVKMLGLEDCVIFTGVRNDVAELLSAMDVFVFPSIYEGLGIVAIEAQTSGLPVIASDVIPKETNITDLIEYISLDAPLKYWVERVLKHITGIHRTDRKREIKKNGFDIVQNAYSLQQFYIENEVKSCH